MAIYRGTGGAGDSTTDATVSDVTEQATIASTKASEAAASATNAATSASQAASSATSAANSASNAATAAASVTTDAAAAEAAKLAAQAAQAAAELAETGAETAETNAASSASASSTSATNAANSASSAATSASNASTSASAAATSASSAAASATAAADNAGTATTQAAYAAISANSASNSATAAASSASAASTSATNAATSETNAATSAANASISETNASTSETNASASETAAAGSAASASTSASNAATSETSASNSASAASTSATNAAASETNAATSETNAAASASAASTSATNAAASESAAATSATSAATSASTATTQAGLASTSASNAATSETNAATSESNAASSATAAASSASSASTSASNAATSATNAAASETAAAGSASAASASADAALAALDSFDDRYLGQKASAPTVDNDGNPLVTGALYFDTTDDAMKVWDGTQWLSAYASLSGALIATNNLSDLTNAATARTNLGLGTAATTDSTAYATAAQGALADAALPASSYTAADVLTKVKTVDGAGSGLDADLLDGQQGTYYAAASSLSNYLPLTGGAITGDVTFGDNNKAIFGAGSDLQIYHDGSNSYVREQGFGSLRIQGADLELSNPSEIKWLKGYNNDRVELFFNNSRKLTTTSTGIYVTDTVTASGDITANGYLQAVSYLYTRNDLRVLNAAGTGWTTWGSRSNGNYNLNVGTINATGIDVTGTVTADGLTVGADDIIQFGTTDNTGLYRTNSGNDLSLQHWGNLSMLIDSDNNDSGTRQFLIGRNSQDASTASKIALFSENGDISFYEDTGTTAKFFWDASTERLGIGNTSPATALDVTGTVTADGLTVDGDVLLNGDRDLHLVATNPNTGTSFQYGELTFGDSFSGQYNNHAKIISNGGYANTTNLEFHTSANNSSPLRMLISSNGDISFYEDTGTTAKFFWDASAEALGIGTSTPSEKFVVEGASPFILVNNTDESRSGIRFADFQNIGERFQLAFDASTAAMCFDRVESTGVITERLRINSAGNVGIGTASPAAKLDVNGTLAISGSTGTSGQVLTSNGASAPSWQTFSGGTAQTSSNAANGWWKCNDTGVIMQWGYNAGLSPTVRTASFPIAFPNACTSVSASPYDGTVTGATYCPKIRVPSTTSFQYNSGSTDVGIYWIAIGY